jgi:hypothetical protein
MAFEHRIEGQLQRPLGSGGGCWDCDVLTVTGLSVWVMMMERLGELPPKGEFNPCLVAFVRDKGDCCSALQTFVADHNPKPHTNPAKSGRTAEQRNLSNFVGPLVPKIKQSSMTGHRNCKIGPLKWARARRGCATPAADIE